MISADYWIENLGLQKHPEGGYFKEVYRSDEKAASDSLPERYTGDRHYSTSIYFLIKENDFSAFHRIKSDEIWHFHAGTSMMIYIIDEKGTLQKRRIGNDPEEGDELQVMIPKQQWFAAELIDKSSYGLVGCTVAPAFDFDDFELAVKNQLIKEFPKYKDLIERLSY